jgi:hypothetical protein
MVNPSLELTQYLEECYEFKRTRETLSAKYLTKVQLHLPTGTLTRFENQTVKHQISANALTHPTPTRRHSQLYALTLTTSLP